MVRPCSCPASDKLARGAQTRSTQCPQQRRLWRDEASRRRRHIWKSTWPASRRPCCVVFVLRPWGQLL